VVKRVKKDNITPQNIGEILLCQIPNISTVSAMAIMQKFGSIQQLIHAMETDPHCLDNMTTESSSGVRKMSSAVIANLRHYLLESTVPVKPP
jgi:ERCC4-type nuclease